MPNHLTRWFLIGVTVLAAACAYGGVGTWTVYEPKYVPQGSGLLVEVLPAEDMDGHVITWGPLGVNAVRFYPSWNWDAPQAGDELCWLYDQQAQVVWWKGTFSGASDSVQIQFKNCDNNDGWADIYVDNVLEYSINAWRANYTDITVYGTGFTTKAHTIEIDTRAGGGDVSLDYVATPLVGEPAGLALIGLAALGLRRRCRT